MSEAEGYPCFCGKKGGNESILAGPALERYYAAQSGQALGLKEIVAPRHSAVKTPTQFKPGVASPTFSAWR
ncbi:MAG: hypothetical protein EOO60_07080 [Hymenobacter sp.]|nr:MAG: hypothetical protein EOO60_07080 [Hymenobacter sp.]